jgi:plastocyanin
MFNSRLAAPVIALSLAIGGSAVAQPAAQVIQVWSFGFAPNPIYLTAGRPVTLTFANQSGSSHDFVAKTFFANARVIRGDVEDGEVDLRAHQSVSVTLVPRAGTYSAHCSHFLHKQFGMNDVIVVR